MLGLLDLLFRFLNLRGSFRGSCSLFHGFGGFLLFLGCTNGLFSLSLTNLQKLKKKNIISIINRLFCTWYVQAIEMLKNSRSYLWFHISLSLDFGKRCTHNSPLEFVSSPCPTLLLFFFLTLLMLPPRKTRKINI